MKSVVLAGGGTGGHIYPLLAFADCLRRHDPEIRITCLGTPRGLENELIPAAGYELRNVPAYQLPRSVNMDLMRTPPRMYKAMQATRAILDDVKAEVVVGFGGYVAVPAYLAAWRRKTPIVVHEVNVPPGVANRLGMRLGGHVAVGFPGQPAATPMLADAEVVGVPLRTSISTLDRAARRAEARAHFGLDPDRPT
ncbi:MAG: glycosyltransferase, partial [Longispora sp.]|nr:glycosyltransferase [Longispora sp. (in: high G+C Gram-positive bacteria)]